MSVTRFFMNHFGSKTKPKEADPGHSVQEICEGIDKLTLVPPEVAAQVCVNQDVEQKLEEAESTAQVCVNREVEQKLEEKNISDSSSSYSSAEEEDCDKVKFGMTPAQLPDETLVDEYRVKLYCFQDFKRQWNERGVGKMCVYRLNAQKGEYRVVMWVDQTGRLACNFRLFPEFQVREDVNNRKQAFWKCMDSLDAGSSTLETFACRFISEDKCKDFMNKVMRYSSERSSSPDQPEQSIDDDDVAHCSGCIGCAPDAFQFPRYSQVKKITENPINLAMDENSCSDIPNTVQPALFGI